MIVLVEAWTRPWQQLLPSNFTLVHDDIMDDAPIRRGQETVHTKWNVNTGILSGDAMLIMAYQYLQDYDPVRLKPLFQSFNQTALDVCEGQQYDVDFEERDDVSLEEYLRMIKYKTAVLIGTALKLGAIVAGAPVKEQRLIESFGIKLGLAFQIQDDYLDAFGDPESFGKQVGGDIIENKKTILYLKALELSDAPKELRTLYSNDSIDKGDKVEKVKSIFKACGADRAIRKEIEVYAREAYDILDELSVSEDKKAYFRAFADKLMNRTH